MKLSERLDLAAKILRDMGGQSAMAATVREAAELARRVEDAPAAEVARVSVGDHGPHVIYTGLPQGQRVRIVPEQGEGDRG